MANKTTNEGYIGSNVYHDSGWKKRIADESSLIQQSNGMITFYTSGSGSAGSAIDWGAPKVRISNGGSINVHDEVTWNGNNSGNPRALKVGYSGGNYGGIGYGIDFTSISDTWNYAVADRVSLIDFRNGGFRFFGTPTVGTVGNAVPFNILLDISNNGNVGIGGQRDPNYRLTLYNPIGGAHLKFVRGSGVAMIAQDNNQNNLYIDAPANLLLNWNGGNVGIGGTPTYQLDVQKAGSAQMRLLSTSSGQMEIIFQRTNATPTSWSQYVPSGSTDMRLYNAGDRFAFSASGIGTSTDWVATSDRRLKYNIVTAGSQLNKVNAIAKLVRNYERTDTKKNETGFVAQELLEVASEYVNVPADTTQMMSVNYSKMVVPLYKAVAELSAEVEALKKEIKDLKALLESDDSEWVPGAGFRCPGV